MVAPVEALAAMPEGLSDVEAALLLCAGITTFNALRHSGALPGDLVAVQGINATAVNQTVQIGRPRVTNLGWLLQLNSLIQLGLGSENSIGTEKTRLQ
jgi:hypothetical protein